MIVEEDGYRFTRERTLDEDRVRAMYAIRTGRETLVLVTRFDGRTGKLACELSLDTTDGVRVRAALVVNVAVDRERGPRLPARDPAGDYLREDPDAHGPLDDFADLAGEAPPRGGSDEGVVSVLEGAIIGGFGDNDSWSAVGGQTAVGFVPIAGQVADIRDIAVAGGDVWNGRPGSWATLGIAVVAVIPGLDFLKGGGRASRKALADAREHALDGKAGASMKRLARRISPRVAERAAAEIRVLNAGRVELIQRLNMRLTDRRLIDDYKNRLRKTRNALRRNLKPDDLAGALRDRLGMPVRKRGTAEPYDHLKEVRNGVNSINKTIAVLDLVSDATPRGSARFRAIRDDMKALSEMANRIERFLEIR